MPTMTKTGKSMYWHFMRIGEDIGRQGIHPAMKLQSSMSCCTVSLVASSPALDEWHGPAPYEWACRAVLPAAGYHLCKSHLQALVLALFVTCLEVPHLPAITEPVLLWRQQRSLAITAVHELLRPPPAPSPSGAPGHQSNPGSGW
jgi:hypothetical protein